MSAPLLVSLAFDAETDDVLNSAKQLATEMGAPLAAFHALGWRPLESDEHLEQRIEETREKLLSHLAPLQDAGVEVLEPIIKQGRPDELAVETSLRIAAQMIVTGGGGPPNVRRWVLGSTAERIVRSSYLPVFVARGAFPVNPRPILCPIDLSPHSRTGLLAAVRMARLFSCKLITLTVIPETDAGWLTVEDLEHAVAREEATAQQQVHEFVETVDMEGLEVEHRVVIGEPGKRIVEASDEAWLLVIASRSFEELLPTALGGVAERALRMSRCSALTIRESDPAAERREVAIQKLAQLKHQAEEYMAKGEPERALPLLQLAVSRASVNAMLQERLADALEAVGRPDEADGRRNLAKLIREQFA